VDLSTFSKASQNRDYQAFNQIYLSLNHELIYAIDSTSRLFGLAQSPLRSTLTSKLFWMSAYHQMKLVMLLDTETGSILIVYWILQFRQIPQIYGDTLLNKLRYVNLILSQEGNLISLSERLFSLACM